MGAVGRILIIVVVVVAIAAGIVFFVLPNKASRSQSITVERPPASVFARLASTPPGTPIAEGVTLAQVTSAENNVVVGNVTYAEGKTGQVTYTVAPEGQGSRVQVKLDQDLGSNPLNRIQAITGGDVGPLVQAAATSITTDLNALPNATFTGLAYDVEQVEAKPFFYVENCSQTDAESITSIISQAVAGIPPVMRTNNLQVAGPLMAVEPRVVSGQYCYQVGYPYTGRQPRALLIGKTGQTPNGTVLHIHYTGAEADVINQVYNPMDALLGAAHLDDPSKTDDDWTTYEVYNDDPTQAGGSRNREIYYVAQGDISRLNAILPPTAAAAAPGPAMTDTAPAATTTTTTPTTPAPATTP
jgi:hypothetical protein